MNHAGEQAAEKLCGHAGISAGCSNRPSSKAAASEEVRRTLRYVEPLSDARTKLADCFSILLGAMSIGGRKGLFEDRAEAEVGNGIFEVRIQPLESSHVRVGDVFHR